MIDLVGGLVLLAILFGLVWLVVRLIAAMIGTVGWSLSGEAGGLLVRGFCSKGGRYRRTADLERVIGCLSLAVRQNLPLIDVIRATLPGEEGRVADMLEGIGVRLSRGRSLSEAVHGAIWNCPDLLLAIIREGERTGRLADALTDVERLLADRLVDGPQRTQPAFIFAALTLVSGVSILAGVMYWVIPKFKEIFADFDTPLPAPTKGLIHLAPGILVGTCGLLALVGLTLLGTAFGLGRASDGRPMLLARCVAALRRVIPGARTIDYGLGVSAVIRQFAAHLRAGMPLHLLPSLDEALRPTNYLCRPVRRFVHDLRLGAVPHEAAQEAGLGDVFVASLRMIDRGEDPATVLDHAAEYYRAIGERWRDVYATIAAPLTTLLVAIAAGFVAYSLFIPLVALIDSIVASMEWS